MKADGTSFAGSSGLPSKQAWVPYPSQGAGVSDIRTVRATGYGRPGRGAAYRQTVFMLRAVPDAQHFLTVAGMIKSSFALL